MENLFLLPNSYVSNNTDIQKYKINNYFTNDDIYPVYKYFVLDNSYISSLN